MKNSIFKLLFLVSLPLTFISCEEELEVYDVENGQTLAQFSQASASLPTPEAGASTTLDVLVTTVSSADRAIEVSVDESSTATTDQYVLSDLVIPANSYVGTITITGNFDAIPETGSSNLVLNLESIANGETLVEKGTYTLELFRKCGIVLSDFVGTWTGDGAWGNTSLGYETEVVTFLNEDGELMINGLAFGWFQDWWGEVIVTNDPVKMDVDLETGEITIAEQFYITSTYNGDPQPSYNLKGTGMVLNACLKTMQIKPVFVQGGTAIDGTTWGPVFVENISLIQE